MAAITSDRLARVGKEIDRRVRSGLLRRASGSTVRARRWQTSRLLGEIKLQTAPLKLYLTEDFHEAASAFAEKRPPAPFKGR